MTLWPTDVPWGGDDMLLIGNARAANAAHRLTAGGLGGSFNVPYGPLPTQVYQALLLVTDDLPTVVRLHAAALAGVTAVGLLWLAASLGWSPWLAVLPMLSPFFWLYGRLLWDNPMAWPLGTIMVAGYADHLRRSSRAGLLVAAGCGAALPLVHPMTLPLVAAICGHAVLFRRADLRRHGIGIIVVVAVVVAPSGPYFARLARRGWPKPAAVAEVDAAGYARLSRVEGLAYPLLSGRLLSAYPFFDRRGPETGWETTAVGPVARGVSATGYLFVVVGMIVAGSGTESGRFGPDGRPYSVERVQVDLDAGHGRRGTVTRPGRHGPALSGLGRTVAGIALVALGLQSLLDAALRVAPYPHYFNGTWPAAVVCLWVGVRQAAGSRLGRVLVGTYAASLAIATATFVRDIHRDPTGSVWHGPTLGVGLADR